jgi:hypothetical protein
MEETLITLEDLDRIEAEIAEVDNEYWSKNERAEYEEWLYRMDQLAYGGQMEEAGLLY